MTDTELLQAISNMIDEKLSPINERLDSIELQVKSTERTLKNEIRKSESLILDEVERVHNILDKHKQDKKAHSA